MPTTNLCPVISSFIELFFKINIKINKKVTDS